MARICLWGSLSTLVILASVGCWQRRLGHARSRRLAETAGDVEENVFGESSAEELDVRARAMTQEPDTGTSLPALLQYFVALQKWDPHGQPSVRTNGLFKSFPVAELQQNLPINMSRDGEKLPPEMRGVWCAETHPSELACFIPYTSEREFYREKVKSAGRDFPEHGLPCQGFKPQHMFMWDSGGTRNTLEFFASFSLEFAFPRAAAGVTYPMASAIWTFGRTPFDILPYPAAVYEGLPKGHHNLVKTRAAGGLGWDPETSDDPAICFCSVTMLSRNVIQRNNFGKVAYMVYRVIDENGALTEHHPKLEQWARGRDLVTLTEPLSPDWSCSSSCVVSVIFKIATLFGSLLLFATCCCCCFPGIGYFYWKKRSGEKNSFDSDSSNSEGEE